VRFIEYMDVGGATRWSPTAVVSRAEMLQIIGRHYGGVIATGDQGSAPAERFLLPDGTTFGIIASTTEPFCAACDRSRLSADGLWLLCLYARGGLDLRHPLREGATHEELTHLISTVWSMRADRGAEERLASPAREVLIPVAALKRDAHLEMHTRGG
jgi:cyclic pyranopterin phosphate synthase